MDKSTFKCVYNVGKTSTTATLTPEAESVDDILTHISNLMSAVPPTLAKLTSFIPVLREVTDEERQYNTYIFADEEQQRLYKMRADLYDSLVKGFTDVFDQVFVDVLYVRACKRYYEDYAFEHTPEEVENLKFDLEIIKQRVLDNLSKAEESGADTDEEKEEV